MTSNGGLCLGFNSRCRWGPTFTHSLPFSNPTFSLLSSSAFFKRCHLYSIPKLGTGQDKLRERSFTIRSSGDSSGSLMPIAPLQFESPVGQLLSQILQTHPHLLIAAVDQQLQNIQDDTGEQGKEASRQDLLYKIMADYFLENPKYSLEVFRRRFRMQRHLFLRILKAVSEHDNYFTYKRDACGLPSLTGMQKVVACIRLLAYGSVADAWDEYVQIGKSTLLESLRNFCDAVMSIFEEQYLRAPNEEDIQRLLQQGASRGFPGMLGSLDCMH